MPSTPGDSAKSAPTPRLLGPRAVRAFNRIGDIICPREGDLPSFSELGCIAWVDEILGHAPAEDVASLRKLLWVLSFKPDWVLRWLLHRTQRPEAWPEPLATLFRQLDIGLRSVVLSLYYSNEHAPGYAGKLPLEVMGYHLNIVRPSRGRSPQA